MSSSWIFHPCILGPLWLIQLTFLSLMVWDTTLQLFHGLSSSRDISFKLIWLFGTSSLLLTLFEIAAYSRRVSFISRPFSPGFYFVANAVKGVWVVLGVCMFVQDYLFVGTWRGLAMIFGAILVFVFLPPFVYASMVYRCSRAKEQRLRGDAELGCQCEK